MHGGRPTRRPPTCRRATRGLPARFALAADLGGGTPSCDVGPDARDRPRCRGRNRTDGGRLMRPAWVPAPALQKNHFEHAAGIEQRGNPERVPGPSRDGSSEAKPRRSHATRLAGLEGRCLMPIGHACVLERPAGVEPAPPNWQAGVQPGTPWARKRVEGGNRTRVCTELQSVAFPSWRPRQMSEPARDSVHHRSPGLAHSEDTAGGRGIEPRWPVLETSAIPDRRPRLWVTVRYRSGTFAFTARRAEPLHHGHHGQVEAGGVAPSSRAYHARALLLSYASESLGARSRVGQLGNPGRVPGPSRDGTCEAKPRWSHAT